MKAKRVYPLGVKSIGKLIDDLNNVKKKVGDLSSSETMLNIGLWAKGYLISVTKRQSGNLAGTTHFTMRKRGITIRQTSKYAKYVEYGTGVMGRNNPHPLAGIKGWHYSSGSKTDSSGSWWYPKNNGVRLKLFRTQGQKAGMQMYRTRLAVRARFKDELSKKVHLVIRGFGNTR